MAHYNREKDQNIISLAPTPQPSPNKAGRHNAEPKPDSWVWKIQSFAPSVRKAKQNSTKTVEDCGVTWRPDALEIDTDDVPKYSKPFIGRTIYYMIGALLFSCGFAFFTTAIEYFISGSLHAAFKTYLAVGIVLFMVLHVWRYFKMTPLK